MLFLTDLGTISRFVSRFGLSGDELFLDLEFGVENPGVETPDVFLDLARDILPIMLNGESTFSMFSPRMNLSSFPIQAS